MTGKNFIVCLNMLSEVKDIRKLEVEGQQQLLQSDVLPTECNRNQFEKIGVVFGELAQNDPLFVFSTLPPGWRKVAKPNTISRYISYLLDDKGRVRGEIFYNPQPRSRVARMDGPMHRINVESKGGVIGVFDGDCVLVNVDDLDPVNGQTPQEKADHAIRLLREWADKHFPGWDDVDAYWEVDDLNSM